MDEASSKFVDKLSIQKLINEKLMKVKHSPYDSCYANEVISLDSIENHNLSESDIELLDKRDDEECFKIPSMCKQKYHPENNHIYVYFHPSVQPQYNIILTHGLFDENLMNYKYLIKQLNEMNYNVYFMVLPYHFKRKPKESLFGGEFFFSADLFRTKYAFNQAVMDIEVVKKFIGYKNNLPTRLIGFSMGACLAFKYYLIKKSSIKTFLINPVTEFKKLAWDTQLLETIGRDLNESGFDNDFIMKIFTELDPCENIGMDFKTDNLAMVYSTYDQIISNVKYNTFIQRIGVKNVFEYSAGHLNVFRVPRLVRDIHDFFCS